MTTATQNRIRAIAARSTSPSSRSLAMDTREIADTYFEGSIAKARRCHRLPERRPDRQPRRERRGAGRRAARRVRDR